MGSLLVLLHGTKSTREDFSRMEGENEQLRGKCEHLEGENARLREELKKNSGASGGRVDVEAW
jgi:predicted nuclease with TOPRIM domain